MRLAAVCHSTRRTVFIGTVYAILPARALAESATTEKDSTTVLAARLPRRVSRYVDWLQKHGYFGPSLQWHALSMLNTPRRWSM